MKKASIVSILILVFNFPAAAKTNLLNFAFDVHGDIFGNGYYNSRSIGGDFIHLGGDTIGFYSQINPYFTTSFKITSTGTVTKLSDYDEVFVGINSIFGLGGDINFGEMGLILGGGLCLDANYYAYSGGGVFTFLYGVGLGTNFYFQPGTGSFVLNAGLGLALTPWAFRSYQSGYTGNYESWNMTNFSINFGIGWRTGNKRARTQENTKDDW